MASMKISIITAVLNRENTIGDCIQSVLSQDYPNIEYIVIDGGSTDATNDIIQEYKDQIDFCRSEPDKGIYDAMNKGLLRATGDVVGFLNSDDFYAGNECLTNVADCLDGFKVDSCYADLVYVDASNIDREIRYWRAGDFQKRRFRAGWMPPHPTFFARKSVYEKHGLFSLRFPLAADYELMLRFLYRNHVSTIYIPRCLVKMRTGGACRPSLINTFNNVRENYQAWKINGLRPNPFTFILKPLSKISQYVPFNSFAPGLSRSRTDFQSHQGKSQLSAN